MNSDAPMMRLARAVYGEYAHVGPHYDIPANGPVVYTDCMVRIASDDGGIDPFDPANNDAQAIDVLCWLIGNTCMDWHKPDCNAIGAEHSIVLCDYDGQTFDHDNTPPSLRAAITAAALRVVGE